MSIDKQALREAAEKATGAHDRLSVMPADNILDISQHEGTQLDADIAALNVFNEAANPATVLALLNELEAADKRIDDLEESHAQVIHSRDHYKRVTDEGIRSLAEARTLTVKLQGYAVREGHPINEGKRGVMFPKDGGPWFSRFEVEHALHVAGIQLKVEE